MQITFDPTDKREADYVRKMLGMQLPSGHDVAGSTHVVNNSTTFVSKELQERAQGIAADDMPDVGADRPRSGEVVIHSYEDAPSAVPLAPPAPSTAAADLFPTVPAVPVASIPPAPPVPSPPAVAVPPVPSAPAAPAAQASLAELDKNGLPWDERIHAGTKAKNADGSWRQRRGLNDEGLVKRVEAELRQLVANNATSAAPLSPTPAQPVEGAELSSNMTAGVSATASPVTAPAVSVPPAPSVATVVVPPPPVTPATPPAVPAPPALAGAPTPTIPPAPPVPPAASTPAPEVNFYQLMDMITKAISGGRLTDVQINEQMAFEGIQPTEIGLLAGDAVKTQAVANRLHALLGGAGV